MAAARPVGAPGAGDGAGRERPPPGQLAGARGAERGLARPLCGSGSGKVGAVRGAGCGGAGVGVGWVCMENPRTFCVEQGGCVWGARGCAGWVCGNRGVCAGQGCGYRVLGTEGAPCVCVRDWGSAEVVGQGSVCAGCVWGDGWVWTVSGG